MNLCPECHEPLSGRAPAGLCPICLMRAGLESEADVGTGPSMGDGCGEAGHPAIADTTLCDAFEVQGDRALAAQFPQLEILELLGRGGMGAVYKGRQIKLDRLIALKVVRPESAGDPEFAERFMREARTLARLNHPGIVAVHDFGEVIQASGDGAPPLFYIVMEYVDGPNLREVMHAGQLEPALVASLTAQICDALQYAHDQGIVHRDIKPENILIDPHGRVKIADFGLARLVDRSPQDFTLTATHQVMGTPRYMAPEQMSGSRDVDHRADIYSLGVVVYEMLTSELPVGSFDPPSCKSDVDGRLDQIVLQAMATEPERRFERVAEMGAAIRSIDPLRASGQGAADSRNAWPGPSTVIDRQIAGLARAMHPGSIHRRLRHPAMPGLMTILCGLLGIAMLAVPWARIGPTDSPMGREPEELVIGFDHNLARAVGVTFFCLILASVIGGASERVPRWRPWFSLGAGALVIGLIVCFGDRLAIESGVPAVGLLWGAQVSLGAGVAVTLLGAWELRVSTAQTQRDAVNRPVQPVEPPHPSRALPVRALLLFLGANLWGVAAVILIVGRKVARTQPLRYSFFELGGWLEPATYNLLIVLSAALSAACLLAVWHSRDREH